VNEEVSLNGLPTGREAHHHGLAGVEGLGRAHVQYKLRDWLFSRQRYWGEPFPILHNPKPARSSAWTKPTCRSSCRRWTDFSPTASDDPEAPPQPPLSRAPASWRTSRWTAETYERELNTMPQWAGSCWYYLRFCDPER
jgi:leucyl-tRNA synthetase